MVEELKRWKSSVIRGGKGGKSVGAEDGLVIKRSVSR